MSKNLDKTVRLQSEKTQESIREIREKRLQGIAESASSAPRLASTSVALFLGRNECPGTHCSLIVQKEREDRSCQIYQRVCDRRKDKRENREARTERELHRRRREEKKNDKLDGAAETSKKHAEWRKLHRKNSSTLGLLKRKIGLSATERAVGKYARAAFAKVNRAVSPEYQIMREERVKVSERLASDKEIRAKA